MTFTTSSLSYLDGLTDQNQIEVESLDSFTDRYAPVQSISGGTITMQQPAWDNNTWGYDTMNAAWTRCTWRTTTRSCSRPGSGTWTRPPASCSTRPPPARTRTASTSNCRSSRSLVQVSGSYSSPVSGLSFTNITFTGTSWLGPSSSQGYADQQSGTFLTGTWHAALDRRLLQRLPAVRGHPAVLGPDARRRAGLRGHQHHLQRRHLHRPRRGRPRRRQGRRTPTPAGPAWAPATSPSPATRSATTRAAGSWSAGSRPTPTTRATRR